MATKNQATQLCCISIGYHELLLPVDAGLKVIALLQNAVQCRSGFSDRRTYIVNPDPLVIEMAVVNRSQVVEPSESKPRRSQAALLTKGTQTLLLGND